MFPQSLRWCIAGAIGSAEWSGVKLRDVLRFAGFDEDASDGVAHVQFEGLDSDVSGTCYGASIPIDKAMGSHGDVLLAFSMNGRYMLACCCAVVLSSILQVCNSPAPAAVAVKAAAAVIAPAISSCHDDRVLALNVSLPYIVYDQLKLVVVGVGIMFQFTLFSVTYLSWSCSRTLHNLKWQCSSILQQHGHE